MYFNTTDGSMQYFKSRKPIAWNVQVRGSRIDISDTIIDAYSTTGSFPFNTDGLDVTATDVTITNSVIYNGDDAIAVQSGSHNVLFRGGTIGYQTHGMSIGSLGQNQASFANVSNIAFDDITIINGVYGKHIVTIALPSADSLDSCTLQIMGRWTGSCAKYLLDKHACLQRDFPNLRHPNLHQPGW